MDEDHVFTERLLREFISMLEYKIKRLKIAIYILAAVMIGMIVTGLILWRMG